MSIFLVPAQSLQQWRCQARRAALAQEVPPGEVDWLLGELARVDRLALRLAPPTATLSLACDLPTLADLWDQRLTQRIPLQYLVGTTPWRNFRLQVSPDVLIPRPETEQIIDLAQMAVCQPGCPPDLDRGIWADLGTGCGAIALGLAEVFPSARVYGVDASAEALSVAERNAQEHGLIDRITLLQGSWLEPLAHLRGGLSAIVSNPPYIPSAEVLRLQPEVQDHEPRLALDGGEDGLDGIRALVAGGLVFLRSGGIWLVEHMAGQSAVIQGLLAETGGYCEIRGVDDWGGLDRFVLARRR